MGQLSLGLRQGTLKWPPLPMYTELVIQIFRFHMCFKEEENISKCAFFSTSQEIRVIKPSIHYILARAKTTPTSRPNTVQSSGLAEAETRDSESSYHLNPQNSVKRISSKIPWRKD